MGIVAAQIHIVMGGLNEEPGLTFELQQESQPDGPRQLHIRFPTFEDAVHEAEFRRAALEAMGAKVHVRVSLRNGVSHNLEELQEILSGYPNGPSDPPPIDQYWDTTGA